MTVHTDTHVRIGPGKCACGYDTYKLGIFFADHHELLMAHFVTVRRQSEAPRNTAEDRVRALEAVLADREQELLELKGPCRTCRLHFAHSGPCAPADRSRS